MFEFRASFFRRAAAGMGALALTLAFGWVHPAYCWDKFGHEAITQIAYDHLTPAARANADQLIAAMASDPNVVAEASEYKPYNFVTAGAWMDDQRSVTKEFNTWHYVDLPVDANLTAAQVAAYRDENPSNAYIALTTYCIPTLENRSAPLAERARALGFFLHLAADMHQPLHAVGRDAGGNRYAIGELPGADPTWRITNLHSFWDNAYRYTGSGGKISVVVTGLDLPRVAPGQGPLEAFAKQLEAGYMPNDLWQVTDLDPADWAMESSHIAATFAFPADDTHTLTPNYVQKASDIARHRLVLAGLREAAVLNLILAPAPQAAK